MNRKVTVTMVVNPKEYYQARNTENGATSLVQAVLLGTADLPKKLVIKCGKAVRTLFPYRGRKD